MTHVQQKDVVDVLLEQHNEIKTLFNQVANARGEHKRELFEDLTRLLAVHESAEEEVVHPVARRTLDNGEQVVERRLQEEDQAKHTLAELYDLGVDHPDFDSRFSMLAQAVLAHATQEENAELRYLRQYVPAERLQRMAGAFRVAEKVAPTRPHPHAGESAAANLLAGPPLAVFDRVRDALRDWRQSNRDDG